ncbi:serine protease [Flagelloscypha sp. PMI_526]|nr:serine protease [Flagelloscypha sp. PMI_526]
MLSFTSLTSLAVLAASTIVNAAPTTVPRAKLSVSKYAGEKTGRYIVRLKEGAEVASVSDAISGNVVSRWNRVFKGFAIDSDEGLDEILARDDVESVEEDGIFKITATQPDAPWGISRVSASGKLNSTDAGALDFEYTFENATTTVDVYVVDTGVNTEHEDFGGRASWGKTFGGYDDADGNGHGTHCAGTIGGTQYGVAKNANIFAVKVLSDAGSGSTTDIVDGLEWVGDQAESTGNPTIVSMSLGGSASSALDDAVSALIDAGVYVVVAAGNEGADAGSTSPARVKTAITVGASDITDTIADFSNFGSVVDVLAPGVDIISAWKGSKTATNQISGTSMATPHVAGLVAYLLGTGETGAPAAISDLIKSSGQSGAIADVPSGTTDTMIHHD